MSIYEELAKARRAIPLTQDMVAERAQLSRMTVSNAEAGKDPQMSTVLEMARAMGMELMLVPRTLRVELENFIQSGGRIVGQQSGVDAPRSVVESLTMRDIAKGGLTSTRNKFLPSMPPPTKRGQIHNPQAQEKVENGKAADTNRPVVALPKAATKSRTVPRPKGQ